MRTRKNIAKQQQKVLTVEGFFTKYKRPKKRKMATKIPSGFTQLCTQQCARERLQAPKNVSGASKVTN